MNSTRRSRVRGLGPLRMCQIFLRIAAQGVTPIPVPMSTAISLSNTSSADAPYGPSMQGVGIVWPFWRATSFVYAILIDPVVEFGLCVACSEGVPQGSGKVANLTDVDGDVVIEGAGGDGKWIPLLARDRGSVQEKPLACFVLYGGLLELDLHSI
jgi:hypothetical protein